MLYKKNGNPQLAEELFQNPTSEYRGTPFWAWNCRLDREELLRQIDVLREMGFGGFHMHVRSGMATEYLSEDFFSLIRSCVEKAKDTDMLAWLYDEDRWPSGAAGGLITKNPKYRQRMLLFTPEPLAGAVTREESLVSGKPCLLSTYQVKLNDGGELAGYGAGAEKPDWYAYMITPEESGWFNRQTYIDTLSKEAVDRFIELTHEGYKREVGGDFGKTIPAIFTDEPEFASKETLDFAQSQQDVRIPWSYDFAEGFRETYGDDILEKLPELFWELPEGDVSVTRYRYHDYAVERFVEAFAKNCGQWCDRNGIALTGHMMEEPTLQSQTAMIGEAMRAYPYFALPGIDMLCAWVELTTAKQAQSAAHQYGREGVMSELYGVTNWDFDFRGHKFHGDWQAALGVTVRVPHLSWVSMEGDAKRDYPASISYQSPWYKEYRFVEDHFARLNTALTRGKPDVRVGVIHPIESFWLHYGPKENTADIRTQLDRQFRDITEWLLTGLIDFDFLCESLLPSQCGEITDSLSVGAMRYDAVVVPGCEMLRGTTLEILKTFRARGGRVIFAGEAPKYIDVKPSEEGVRLWAASEHVPFDRVSLLGALEDLRSVGVRNADGTSADNLLYQFRTDGDNKWLFLAHHHGYNTAWTAGPAKNVVVPQPVRITVRGEYTPVLWNTQDGTMERLPFEREGGNTVIPRVLYAQDSLLVQLLPGTEEAFTVAEDNYEAAGAIDWKQKVPYTISEPNVLLLDMAEFSLDGGKYEPKEELLRIIAELKKRLGLRNDGAQPWVIEEKPTKHIVSLRFSVDSEIEAEGIRLALENPQLAEIRWNGELITAEPDGYFTDRSIKTVPLGMLRRGSNELVLRQPVGERTCLEWCYLLGSFGVRVDGCTTTAVPLPEKLAFGSFTGQGLPFYGANVTYHADLRLTEDCGAVVHVPNYSGSLVRVAVDGQDRGVIAYAPYDLDVGDLKSGEHTVSFTLFGNRHNSFGALHNCNPGLTWFGPDAWHSEGDAWSYEYNLKDMGILSSPVVKLRKKA